MTMVEELIVSKEKYTGGCACGRVSFSISGKASFPHFCSCNVCQRWSGAPVVAWVDFPLNALDWTGPDGQGERTTNGNMGNIAFG